MAAAGSSPLVTLTLFSSTAALLGPAGQANYAAANAVLGAAAESYSHAGIAATSVMWGAWAAGGMAAAGKGTLARLQRLGMVPIQPAAGLSALAGILAQAGARPQASAAAHLACGSLMPSRVASVTAHALEGPVACD